MIHKPHVLPGKTHPLGATVFPYGVNFCFFSKKATAVELLLFNKDDHRQPAHVIPLNPELNKTFYYWHCFMPELESGQLYGYRVYGRYEPQEGLRFDGQKVLIDPYARAVVTDTYDREAARHPGDNCATAIKSVVVDPGQYDWEGDRPLYHPFRRSVIYELHIGGFTKDPSSGLPGELRGTYRGLIEKIPYLKQLGITAVELMPVQQFDPQDTPGDLPNYWGYAPVAFFAPHNDYATTDDPLGVINEFRDMVKALHRAGIEVILDVVFNHTAEGGLDGPTLSFKGIENVAYYILEERDKRLYKNFSGTGNTMNANHSIVRRLIRDALRHWVSEMHVDGFRFDLASVLSRDEAGRPLENPPLLWEIESDPILAPTKIIAEAWDIEQYQLGSFIGDKWAEWNGRFRDDVRRFIKGDEGMVWAFANCIHGSPDLFRQPMRNPHRSINFVTCHDGFTLHDLVTYNEKHNWANGEKNRDGNDANFSWNCGVEGPTDDPGINRLRKRQMKNFLTVLMTSQGTPMLLMGDEIRRTQNGNNNAYCQDNGISWFDWSRIEEEQELFRFVRELISLNISSLYLQEILYWQTHIHNQHTVLTWHGTKLDQPDWGDQSHSIAYSLENPHYSTQLHVMVNAYWEPLTFDLPPLPRKMLPTWFRIVDTYLPYPEDVKEPGKAPKVKSFEYEVQPRSVVVLMALSRKLGDRVFRDSHLLLMQKD
jgi:isoamylase